MRTHVAGLHKACRRVNSSMWRRMDVSSAWKRDQRKKQEEANLGDGGGVCWKWLGVFIVDINPKMDGTEVSSLLSELEIWVVGLSLLVLADQFTNLSVLLPWVLLFLFFYFVWRGRWAKIF